MDRARDPRIDDYGAVLEAMRHLKRELDRSLRDGVDLSLVWFEALLRIERAGGSLTMGALADQVLLSSGGVTRLVDRLSESGLVERRACESDRRVQYVAITARGREALDRALDVHLGDLQRLFFDRLDEAERRAVVAAMTRVREPHEPVCGEGS